MKKSQLKEYIKNEILSILNEAKKGDTEDTEAEETEASPEEDVTADMGTGEISSVQDVQKELMDALEASKKLGDKKLTRQIGNALTYFTRSQITKDEEA
jgi:hypothetical protein